MLESLNFLVNVGGGGGGGVINDKTQCSLGMCIY